MSSLLDLMEFDAASSMDLINQPLLMMAGSKADTYYMTDSAFKLATGTKEKELFLITGATHIQTYYVPEYVSQAMNKLKEFFGKHLSLRAQYEMTKNQSLTEKEKSIILISAYTARGELQDLKPALIEGLEAGLTINEVKEVIVHLYAYCGFPRSIRGLQTFMETLDERKAKGINDKPGTEASPIKEEPDKYERGKKVLGELTLSPQNMPTSGYGAFAPIIDTFLKEHLFADIFERDVLTYAQRELVTISVLCAIGGAEPMLRSHLSICLNAGLSPGQLTEFVSVIQPLTGNEEAKAIKNIVDDVLNNKK
jgi:alkylhydroperoxidase/carboxymuconolactone decarboxylase family protein YurZ